MVNVFGKIRGNSFNFGLIKGFQIY